jgi:hypothetical protein
MNKVQKFLNVIVILCLIFALTGCAKLVNTEYSDVEVTVVDSYHRGMYLQPVYTGKSFTYITHPATYRITVEYDNLEFDIDGSETYYKYEDKIGETAIGVLETRTYDDGMVKYDITELK